MIGEKELRSTRSKHAAVAAVHCTLPRKSHSFQDFLHYTEMLSV